MHYHGMLLKTAWRATGTVTVNANYTWSHCIGEATIVDTVSNIAANYVHVNDRALDAGNCTWDRRNVFNLTVVARTPKFSGKALNLIASGWTLSPLYRFSSGSPLTALSGTGPALEGFNATDA